MILREGKKKDMPIAWEEQDNKNSNIKQVKTAVAAVEIQELATILDRYSDYNLINRHEVIEYSNGETEERKIEGAKLIYFFRL